MGQRLKSGPVGVVAFVIDLEVQPHGVRPTHLMGMLGQGQDAGALHGKPLTAQIILGGGWDVRGVARQSALDLPPPSPAANELALFVAFNLAAMAIAAPA